MLLPSNYFSIELGRGDNLTHFLKIIQIEAGFNFVLHYVMQYENVISATMRI